MKYVLVSILSLMLTLTAAASESSSETRAHEVKKESLETARINKQDAPSEAAKKHEPASTQFLGKRPYVKK